LSSTDRDLTTTSYAILGLLELQPWSTYELATQMRRNLHYFWPRAESNLYIEPKRLERDGLVQSIPEPVGRRRRTVYTITDKGRQALRDWLAVPSASSRLESEVMVKLMWANLGAKSELLATIYAFRAQLEERARVFTGIFGEYLRGEDPFPERLHINVVCYRLLWDLTRAELAWTEWALDWIKKWPGVEQPGDRAPHLLALKRMLARRPD
jgi:PadR family transcriptional regulator, regulatory protein AphA